MNAKRKTGKKKRSLLKKLEDYQARRQTLDAERLQFKKLEEEHKRRTRLDFGMCDGEVMSVESLAFMIATVAGVK